MNRTGGIALAAVMKLFGRVSRHPWIVSKLATLQGERWVLNALGPISSDGGARKIRQVSFRLTDRCNLRCHTCGQWGDGGYLRGGGLHSPNGYPVVERTSEKEELTFHQVCRSLDDLISHGHSPLVYLWGGEPMLHHQCLEMVEEAAARRLPVSMATNGSLVAQAAGRLARAPLFLLQVSIDGHCPDLHDRIRPGSGDNFSRIVHALEAVGEERRRLRSPLPLIASLTVISRRNAEHLVDIYEAFQSRVDLFVFYLSWWIDEERADAHDRDFSGRFGFLPRRHRGWMGTWKPQRYGELHAELDRLTRRACRRDTPPVVLIPSLGGASALGSYYNDHAHCFGFQRCLSIYQMVEVNSNGDVSPCRDYSDYVVGNIKTESLSQLWNSRAYRLFRKSIETRGLMPVCSRCCGLMGY